MHLVFKLTRLVRLSSSAQGCTRYQWDGAYLVWLGYIGEDISIRRFILDTTQDFPPYSSIFSAKFPLIVDSLPDYKSRMVTNSYVIALRQSNFLMKSMSVSSATPMPRSRTRNMATDFWLAPSAFQLPDVLSSAGFCNIWPPNSLSQYLTGAISPQVFCPVDKRCVDRNSDGSFSPCPAPAPPANCTFGL